MQRGRERRRPFEAFGDFAAIPDRGAQDQVGMRAPASTGSAESRALRVYMTMPGSEYACEALQSSAQSGIRTA
jgi:hypothetical protein